MTQTKRALIAVMSHISSDPRVLRQIEWLHDDGWAVDTLGLGERPQGAREHFSLKPEPSWISTRFGTAVIYGLLSHTKKFRLLTAARIPLELRRIVRNGNYDLVILNDRHFVPWAVDSKTFGRAETLAHIHLDLHEYFPEKLGRNTLWLRASAPYYEWARALIGHERFTSRSTVSSGIALQYARELGIEPPTVVRNIPEFSELAPSPTLPGTVRMIHHGITNKRRGLWEIVDAMRLLDDRFVMTFMMMHDDALLQELKEYAADLGDRVLFRQPVPTAKIAECINEYDLEIMFFPPTTRNLEWVLPNKLFEAIQGRLGVVIGESAMMVEIVSEFGNGAVAPEWTVESLAETLSNLSSTQIEAMKWASHSAASQLNASVESTKFRSLVELPSTES